MSALGLQTAGDVLSVLFLYLTLVTGVNSCKYSLVVLKLLLLVVLVLKLLFSS